MGQAGGYLCERTFLHFARGRDPFWILITHGELHELPQSGMLATFDSVPIT
jgi:hypothetical protein